MFSDKLKKLKLNELNGVVLAPDVGSAKMSQAYAKTLGISFAIIDKRRPKANKAEVVNLIGDLNNKHVLIIDDMIDTAGTTCNAADAAIEHGALSVVAVATHPVLSGPAITRLTESKISKVIVCEPGKDHDLMHPEHIQEYLSDGTPNPDYLLFDDLIDTGGTIAMASKVLIEKGAKSVRAIITHPVLSGNAEENLNNSYLNELVVTDSIPLKFRNKKIKVLSIAGLIAKAIRKIHENESTSSLFINR